MTPRLAVVGTASLLSVSLLGSLVLMTAAIQNSARFGALFSVMLITNVLGLVAFVGIIIINVRDLVRRLRQRQPGARLTLRMLIIFVALSVLPIVVLYGFSLNLLTRGVDSWFDVRIGEALDDALELGRGALDLRMREVLNQIEKIAEEISFGSEPSTVLNLDALRNPGSTIVAESWDPGPNDLDLLRRRAGAEELAIVTVQGRLLESSSSGTDLVPNLPSAATLLQVKQGRSYIGLEPIGTEGLYIRVAVAIADDADRGGRILQALYPVAARMDELATSVETAHAKYNELVYLRQKLQLSFAMTLTLVLLSSVATAIWAAFLSARRLSEPISDLAAGTAAVAAGDYETTLPVTTSDDMGFLVSSFNAMTRRIAVARDEIEQQHRYLNTLLSQLSSGVLALDAQGCVTTLNDAGRRILDIGDGTLANEPLAALVDRREHLRPFVEAVQPQLAQSSQHWQQEVQIFSRTGRRVLMCRGSNMSGESTQDAGYVVVFDDVTVLLQGQRDAAWSEVARRLAHEIKNPLTPIQLSAERLRQKYLGKMPPADAETLDRLTTTIVQQVDTMKSMVNTFSDYARTPTINPGKTDLNQLVSAVVDLYRTANPETAFETAFAAELPPASVDAGRLRQVFNNLIKNALEASAGTQVAPQVFVSTRRMNSDAGDYVEIRIEDRGDGIPENLLGNLFEPYVTSKSKGTGLGLAIVKKIVEEHGGLVTLANNDGPGACATIRLPLDGKDAPAGAVDNRRAS